MNDPIEALRIDGPEARKSRGAFFTPPPIAEFLAQWAISGRSGAKVLDPTCGEGVFLLAAAEELSRLGSIEGGLDQQVYGVDVHPPSLEGAMGLLEADGFDARLITNNFFDLEPPGGLLSSLPTFDAVVGNPPFVRYQNHRGATRKASAVAALRQGVRLSGLASSWAALLVHAGGFLAPDGRLAMVLPAELLTVGYAEPVRQWLRQRFAAVKLVIFERLQFNDAIENVVLLLAQGTGGCDAFSLYYVDDAEDLRKIQAFDEFAVTLSADGKWTDLLLSIGQRQLFKSVTATHFTPLGTYGSPELGTVTGANHYFALNEATRREYNLQEGRDVIRISPPGTKHFRGLGFSKADWERLLDAGESVWLLCPTKDGRVTAGLERYLALGESLGVPDAYKCQVRSTWYRPPAVSAPDLFFTYMSHRYPRLINNQANSTFLNSMHGVRLVKEAPKFARDALPLLALNSVTMLGAEVYGRSYGGGVLKMEPREAASLPIPDPKTLEAAWATLKPERAALNRQLKNGLWTNVVARVDEVLLRNTLKLTSENAATIREAARSLRVLAGCLGALQRMPTPDDAQLRQRDELETRVGHPGDLWQSLQDRVQDAAVIGFFDVQDEWLALMWSIDQYRVAGIPPRAMGKPDVEAQARLDAVYRSKGNWFKTLLSLLLQNQTDQPIKPRTKVQGFSQSHQIDLAWPARSTDPLVYAGTRVTGAPAFSSTPARSALPDFTNRRKELKFAATDLKLYRGQEATKIAHWGEWRESAPPRTYFMWGARLRTTDTPPDEPPDDVGRLVVEAKALVDTYLEGSALFAWRERDDHDGYAAVPVPASGRVMQIDGALESMAADIRSLVGPGGKVPKPVRRVERTADVDLAEDERGQ